MKYQIRNIEENEIEQIVHIDRSDRSPVTYSVTDGTHISRSLEFNHHGLLIEQYKPFIDHLQKVLQDEGKVFAAFSSDRMIGICSLDRQPVGKQKNMTNLGLLWVSKEHRREGIAARLVDICKEYALQLGCDRLYISATPSKNTVEFYLRMGATITKDIDPILYEREPEDVHMELLCQKNATSNNRHHV